MALLIITDYDYDHQCLLLCALKISRIKKLFGFIECDPNLISRLLLNRNPVKINTKDRKHILHQLKVVGSVVPQTSSLN